MGKRNKAYIHIKEILVPIYKNVKVVFIVSNSSKKIKRVFPPFDRNHVHATVWEENEWEDTPIRTIVLTLNPDSYCTNKITLGSLAHECLHITNMILNYVGVVASWSNDEPQAYLIGWVYNELVEFLGDVGKLKQIIER